MKQLKLYSTLREAQSLKYLLEDLEYTGKDFQVGYVSGGRGYAIRIYNHSMFHDNRVRGILWAYIKTKITNKK